MTASETAGRGEVVVIAATAARLPDLTDPSVIPLMIALGGLIGAGIGRLRGWPRADVRDLAERWAFAFGVIACLTYLALNIAGV